MKDKISLTATKPVKIFVDKGFYNQPIEYTRLGKIPEDKRENISWKGCDYVIEIGETIIFDRSNNWDVCYFTLSCNVEFKIECAKPEYFIEKYSFTIN
ncbi:MAG TPA: hypothetical protein VIK09_01330 [Candidatus Humimicrobiaceae bacterium]